MTKKTSSGTLPKRPRRAKSEKGTKFGRDLIAGAKEILAHVRGEIKLKGYYLPGPVDVKAIRNKTGMSQTAFAATFGLNRRTLQDWEQGKAVPDGAVRAYLTVIDRNPTAVQEALYPREAAWVRSARLPRAGST
jgi:putative transcriptional regulator